MFTGISVEYTIDHPPPPKCIIYTKLSIQVSPRPLTMAAQEVREYRTLSKKLVEIEKKGPSPELTVQFPYFISHN